MVLVVGVALIAALIVRWGWTPGGWRDVVLVGMAGLGLRLVAVGVIAYIAVAADSNATGVWLNDEASYWRATDALMPSPWDRSLPWGLDHLGGNGYLGLTTAISLAVGSVDSLSFRFANAAIGTIVVLLCAGLGYVFFGRTAGLIAGLGAAVWPDLVLWSATMVRDTLGSLAVVGVWWVLVAADRRRWLMTLCFVVLAIVLLATLRTYLAVAVGVGVVAWLGYPFVRRQRPRTLVISLSCAVVLGALVAVGQLKRIDEAVHELFYRQTVTRMETLGRLYRDPLPSDAIVQLPFRPGAAIALTDPHTGWLMTGLVEDSSEPGFLRISLTDDTVRRVPISEVVLLQDARIPTQQLFSWLTPSALAVFAGLSTTSKTANPVWIPAALAWDGLLVVGIVGVVRSRLPVRDWLFPLCVIGGTIAALIAIPGDPGNAERHRATQTVPLLLVLASGFLASRLIAARGATHFELGATPRPDKLLEPPTICGALTKSPEGSRAPAGRDSV